MKYDGKTNNETSKKRGNETNNVRITQISTHELKETKPVVKLRVEAEKEAETMDAAGTVCIPANVSAVVPSSISQTALGMSASRAQFVSVQHLHLPWSSHNAGLSGQRLLKLTHCFFSRQPRTHVLRIGAEVIRTMGETTEALIAATAGRLEGLAQAGLVVVCNSVGIGDESSGLGSLGSLGSSLGGMLGSHDAALIE